MKLRRTRPTCSRRISALFVITLTAPLPARAGITFYTSRSTFNAAAPGLPIDTFGPTLPYSPYPLDYLFHTRPVNSLTNDSIFPAGSILPGLTITTQAPLFESQALKIEPIAGGNQVGAATFEDTLILDFSPAVSAVGFDLLGHVYSHPLFNGSVEFTALSGSTEQVFTELPVNGSTFVGITSTETNITRVTLLFVYNSDANTFVANVAFGTPMTPAHPGDFNCDGEVNLLDVAPAALRLTNLAEYAAAYPACGDSNADVNSDGIVDGRDLSAFVQCLLSGGCP